MKKVLISLSIATVSLFATEKIVVFHAGSLSVPFSQIEKKFEAKYPQYDVIREAAGSRACARKITDLHRKADVMASADYKVIDNLLMPKYAKFNALFATNEMVIAFTPHSKYANELDHIPDCLLVLPHLLPFVPSVEPHNRLPKPEVFF